MLAMLGASMKAKDANGQTPRNVAAARGHHDCAHCFDKVGADAAALRICSLTSVHHHYCTDATIAPREHIAPLAAAE